MRKLFLFLLPVFLLLVDVPAWGDETIIQDQGDYATLPFSFNGGQASIATTPGLSQNGINAYDYSATNTKLKFDHANDCLILRINETPGTLSFDIKNESFSGGIFKVQTSVDGNQYTDLVTYSSISGTQTEYINYIGADVRYIKWIYFYKSSGNVGLGNIHLYKTIHAYMNEYEWGTMTCGAPLDFSGLTTIKAYIVTGHDGAALTKTQMTGTVPANTPLLINAAYSNDYYEIPLASSSSADVSANKLHPGTGGAVDAGTGVSRFVLSIANDKAVFQKIEGTSAIVSVEKAYLEFDGSAPAPSIIRIADEDNNTTNIESEQAVEEGVKFIRNGKLFIKKNGLVYDMLGTVVR